MTQIEFTKMHGLGNDFIIIHDPKNQYRFSSETIQKWSNRKHGIGCDQWIMLSDSQNADVKMDIFNGNDGQPAEACGNASRCVTLLIHQQTGKTDIEIETKAGILKCRYISDDEISVNMGKAEFEWNKIPLSKEIDPQNIPMDIGLLEKGFAVNIGNPHIVFIRDMLDKKECINLGPEIENHSLFPEKTNVEFIKIKSKSEIEMLVWERGAGMTDACGSGACAVAVAAYEQGHISRDVKICMPGGNLNIHYAEDQSVTMTGPAKISFNGSFAYHE